MSNLDTENMPWNTPAARARQINAPESMDSLTLESYEKKRSLPPGLVTWLSQFDSPRPTSLQSLVLYGKPGRGKTGLGIGALKYLARLGVGDRFEWNLSTGPDLLKKVAAGEIEQEPSPIWFIRWGRLLEQERRHKLDESGWFDTLDEYVSVLMIDDIGTETGEGFRERLLTQHMEWAEDKRGRALILTFNTWPEAWGKAFGERAAGRLIEDRRFVLVKVEGENLRD